MDEGSSIERAGIEVRARRMAAGVIAAHVAFEERARGRDVAEQERAWRALDDQVQHLATMGDLLPSYHVLRLAAEHVRFAHARWTEDPDPERLRFALALALLERACRETERRLELVA
jgi:hypothetical protein